MQGSINNKSVSDLVWCSKTFTMKKATILTMLFFFGTISFCQQTSNEAKQSAIKKFYLQGGTGITSSGGISLDFGLQAVLKSNWTASISYKLVEIEPRNLPDTYQRGYTLLLVFPLYDEFPYNEMDVFSLAVGKYFETGRKTRFTAEAGLSFVNGQTMKFTSQPVISEILYVSSNYSVQKENKTGFGGVVKADFNWALLPFAGLGTGVFANFNSVQSAIGFEVKLLVGKLNKKRKH